MTDTGATQKTIVLPLELSGSFSRFIWNSSAVHQFWLIALSILVFGLAAVPLEIQRRIINAAVKGGDVAAILWLAGIYLAVSLGGGLTKLAVNVYRGWVGETVLRDLRASIDEKIQIDPAHPAADEEQGVEMSLLVAEAEPVGQFVGSATSEPVLQGGLLLSTLGYMVYLQPVMALLVLGVLAPQMVFVPLMQSAINRRAAARIIVLRGVSIAIVRNPATSGDPAQQRRFGEAFELNMGIYKLKFSMNFLMNFMHQIGVCGVLALGGWYVVEGRTEIGTIVAFISGLAGINGPWGDLVNWFRDMQVSRVKYGLISTATNRHPDGDAA